MTHGFHWLCLAHHSFLDQVTLCLLFCVHSSIGVCGTSTFTHKEISMRCNQISVHLLLWCSPAVCWLQPPCICGCHRNRRQMMGLINPISIFGCCSVRQRIMENLETPNSPPAITIGSRGQGYECFSNMYYQHSTIISVYSFSLSMDLLSLSALMLAQMLWTLHSWRCLGMRGTGSTFCLLASDARGRVKVVQTDPPSGTCSLPV